MTDKASRKVLLLSLALCLAAPATSTVALAEDGAKPADAATESKPAAEKKPDRQHGKDALSDIQRRHQDEGYYSGSKTKTDGERMSDIQRRHKDEGYYSDVKQYVAPPPEARPVEPPPVQSVAPVAPVTPASIPPVGTSATPFDRKFQDDTGTTGSITATRHAKQAQDLFASAHYDLAKHHFRESLAMVPNQPELYPGYWESCAKTNDWGEARRCLEKFFELDPAKKKDWGWAYGETWFQLRNYDKAMPVLTEALKYGNHLEEVHTDMLKIGLNRRDSALIAQEYTAIAKIKPGDFKTHVDFANWLEVQGKHGDAINQYKTAAGINPSDGPLQARLAYMLMYYNKDFKGAITYYHKAMVADPLNAAKYQENIKYASSQIEAATPAKKEQQ